MPRGFGLAGAGLESAWTNRRRGRRATVAQSGEVNWVVRTCAYGAQRDGSDSQSFLAVPVV